MRRTMSSRTEIASTIRAGPADHERLAEAVALMASVRSQSASLPAFLLADPGRHADEPLPAMTAARQAVDSTEDLPEILAGQIVQAIDVHRDHGVYRVTNDRAGLWT